MNRLFLFCALCALSALSVSAQGASPTQKPAASSSPVDRCALMRCPGPCKDGACVPVDACARMYCAPGTVCKDGACAKDCPPLPVDDIRCLIDPCSLCKEDETCVPDECGHPCSSTCEKVAPVPECPPKVQCLVDPCSLCKEGEKCEQEPKCGDPCLAKCVEDVGTGDGSCPDGSDPVNCLVDPCDNRYCPQHQTCESNYCGGCNAECKDKPKPRDCSLVRCEKGNECQDGVCVPMPDDCPGGIPQVRCMDPCSRLECGKGSSCVVNKCTPCSGTCVNDCPPQQEIACLIDPCSLCKEDEKCVTEECGHPCSAKCEKVDPVPVPDCPPKVQCLVDPCSLCKKSEKCEPEPKCGDPCSANCVEDEGNGGGSCPDGSNPVNCQVDPCDNKRCRWYQTCESNYCGGCNAECKGRYSWLNPVADRYRS